MRPLLTPSAPTEDHMNRQPTEIVDFRESPSRRMDTGHNHVRPPEHRTWGKRVPELSGSDSPDMTPDKFVSFLGLALWWLAALIAPVQAQVPSFKFGLIGDMPYTGVAEHEYQRVLAALNAPDLAFVIHVGDTQDSPKDFDPNVSTGAAPCSDARYEWIYESFQSVRHPVILTPGDNDWADCHLTREPKVDPLERLAKLRSMFYPEGHSLGQRTIAVESQSKDLPHGKFRENLRWSFGGVTFATLHTIGSNDNFGRTPEMDAEHLERKAANLVWIQAAFAAAKAASSRGLVLMTHANPGFENYWPRDAKSRYFRPFVPRGQPVPSYPAAFDDYIGILAEELEQYDRPAAFLHGDTHLFRTDKPLYSKKTGRVFENFTRVETFGDPDTHWVQVTVDPAEPQLFRFDVRVIPENIVNRVPASRRDNH